MNKRKGIMFLDTETTGLPFRHPGEEYGRALSPNGYPRAVSVAAILDHPELERHEMVCTPWTEGFSIPPEATAIHGIRDGEGKEPVWSVLSSVSMFLREAGTVVGHNVGFDLDVLRGEAEGLKEYGDDTETPYADEFLQLLEGVRVVDTMEAGLRICAIPAPEGYTRSGCEYKYPKLQELYVRLFGRPFDGAHSALADAEAAADCYYELLKRGIVKNI